MNNILSRFNYKLLLLASFTINLMSLALPLMTLQVYDRLLVSNSVYTLYVLTGGVLVICFFESLVRYLRLIIINAYSIRSENSVYNLVIKHILSSDYIDNAIDKDVSYYLQKMSRISKIGDFVSIYVLSNLVDIPFIIIFITLIFYIGGILVLIPIVLLLSYFGVLLWVNKKNNNKIEYKELIDIERLNFIIEVLRAIHTVKSFSIEKMCSRRYERLQFDSSLANYKQYISDLDIINYSNLFSQLIIISIVSFGVPMVLSGELTLGAIIACVLLSSRIMKPIQRAVTMLNKYRDIYTSLELIEDLNNEGESVRNVIPDNKGELEINNLSFGFRKNEKILEDINIKLKIGDSISISGARGSGKTLLLKLIFGLYKIDKGIILVNGKDVSKIPFETMFEQVAFLSIKGVVFSGTIWDNISLYGKYKEKEVLEISALMGLDDEVNKLPDGYQTILEGSNSDVVSPGLKQRIALVRALVCKPRIILFDNTYRALDKDGYNNIYRLLLKIKDKVALIIVSDDENLSKIAKKHYVIKDKKLIENKSYDAYYEDLRNNLIYRELPI